MNRPPKPLYRKVNTTTRGFGWHGGDYADSRHRKPGREDPITRGSMSRYHLTGFDYTPLWRFLLSRVGTPWAPTLTEATARLNNPDVIYCLVKLPPDLARPVVRLGESEYYSALFVDDAGLLQKIDPSLGPETQTPSCACCTHTFNGVPFMRPFVQPEPPRPAPGS